MNDYLKTLIAAQESEERMGKRLKKIKIKLLKLQKSSEEKNDEIVQEDQQVS